jgi:hypothetical protein
MKLIIDIPEEDFERCKKRFQRRIDIMGDAIANGIPLPKGHGRLIDADDIDNHIVGSVDTRDCPTIIEADKERTRNEH